MSLALEQQCMPFIVEYFVAATCHKTKKSEACKLAAVTSRYRAQRCSDKQPLRKGTRHCTQQTDKIQAQRQEHMTCGSSKLQPRLSESAGAQNHNAEIGGTSDVGQKRTEIKFFAMARATSSAENLNAGHNQAKSAVEEVCYVGPRSITRVMLCENRRSLALAYRTSLPLGLTSALWPSAAHSGLCTCTAG